MESENKQGDQQNPPESGDTPSSCGDLPKPTGLRCGSDDIDRIDRFLIQSQLGFVLPVGTVLWIIFFIIR